MSRRLRASLLASTSFALVALLAPASEAATVPGYSMNRYEPSERGSAWFSTESLDFEGNMRPVVGVVADWAYRPQELYATDHSLQNLVSDQLAFHVGAALTVADRFEFGLSLPLYAVSTGNTVQRFDGTYAAPSGGNLGDLRLGANVRLLGDAHGAFRLGLGLAFFLPTGSQDAYTGDGKIRLLPHLNVAGDVGMFAYSARVGYLYRPLQETFALTPIGDEITFGAAAGVKLLDDKLLVGPEFEGQWATSDTGSINSKRLSPASILFGGHYRSGDFVYGISAGPGLSHASGTAAFRTLASFEWAPQPKAAPPPEKDSDGDGVVDSKDACPYVAGVATSDPKTNGCPADRDGDGIPDKDDACPDQHGVKTDDPKTNGCPPPGDRDADGIPDPKDACPDVPGDPSPDPKKNGCPVDRDGDGVPDKVDACPDVKGVATNDPKTNGCPADRDADGIPDDKDACPDIPGPANANPKKNGCPQVAVVKGEIKIFEQVKFKTGSAVILKESDGILDEVAKTLKDHPEIKLVRVEGHTDNVGAPAYNKNLSQKRAESVMAALVKRGIDKKRMTAQGFGQERPIDRNDTEAGRQNNRRVEFHIVDEAKK